MSYESYKIPRHNVFISYYHDEDQCYKDYLCGMTEWNFEKRQSQKIFENWSVMDGDFDDTNMSDEQIRIKIRDEYIDKNASVLILLCGKNTRGRKHVDWELFSAMFDGENRPKLGILVINLPSIEGYSDIVAAGEDKKLASDSTSWYEIKSRKQIEEDLPYLPSRVVDNFESRITDDSIVDITVVGWSRIKDDVDTLKKLIHSAFLKGSNKNKHYNHSRKMRRNNAPINL